MPFIILEAGVYIVRLGDHNGTHIAFTINLWHLMEPWRPEAILQAAGLDCIAFNCIDVFIRGRGRTQYIQYDICTFCCFVKIVLRVHSILGDYSPHILHVWFTGTWLPWCQLSFPWITMSSNGNVLFGHGPLGWISTGYRWISPHNSQ